MVFYFTSSGVHSSAYTIYMGKDKYENEDLIKYGWPEDTWFHVDKLSSAHVYLRLHTGEKIEGIPEVLMDCAHLVKANSIQGCKTNNVHVVYTPWSNLKKTADMDVGQIGFHRQKDVTIVTVEKKVNEILNPLEKTQIRKTSYAQHQPVRQIRKKMMEIMTREVQTNDLKEVVTKLIPDSIGKDIEKACQSIYPLHDVFVRKVKMLKAPRFELGKLMELHGEGSSSGKATGDETGAKAEQLMGMNHQSKNLFKVQTSNSDK
ncbi:Coiled-coil domain-containing protein 25 [Tupaia chinensis]|uniref:Coiled-coil domain-containing protein 25 n=1 Tax=Tupaia chinensis TaxID=246437 RepID=L9L9J2_TUPCH|nr:Coiled-coil domain-containing protein 25 [Tupaia chinensis]